jgi:hypothetical protein
MKVLLVKPTTTAPMVARMAMNRSTTARSPVLWIGGLTEKSIRAVNAVREVWSASAVSTEVIEHGCGFSRRNVANKSDDHSINDTINSV